MKLLITKNLKKWAIIGVWTLSIASFFQGNAFDSCESFYCPPESCCQNFFLSAEVLYWRAFEGGLSNPCDRVDIVNTVDCNIVKSVLEGRNYHSNGSWDLGFRLGQSYEMANNSSELSLYWTHFHTHETEGCHQHRKKWKLDFDAVDALYLCIYQCSPCFSLNPYFGLRYVQIDQSIYKNLTITIDEVLTVSDLHIDENFHGVGPIFGLEGNCNMACGFSLYGNVALGVLYGDFDVDSRKCKDLGTKIHIDHLTNNNSSPQNFIDLGLGVRWETCFCYNKTFMLQLGLEDHCYFNHNQFGNYGDLHLTGVNFGVVFGF
jgi:hypothetical protein